MQDATGWHDSLQAGGPGQSFLRVCAPQEASCIYQPRTPHVGRARSLFKCLRRGHEKLYSRWHAEVS